MKENYVFPRIGIGYTAIPKTGCTTLKNFLLDLEVSSNRSQAEDSRSHRTSGGAIHESSELWRHRVPSFPTNGGKSIFKFVVVRDPFQRALSCWANKFLYAYDFESFKEFKDSDFFLTSFESIHDLRAAFESFTSNLASDEDFLQADRHWMPQHLQCYPLDSYDLVLETSQIDQLPMKLMHHLGVSAADQLPTPPHFNATVSDVLSFIPTKASIDNVYAAYAQDYLAFSGAGLEFAKPRERVDFDAVEMESLIAKERESVMVQRAAAEVRYWKAIGEKLLASKSWRYTAWLRWLTGFSDRRRRRWLSDK